MMNDGIRQDTFPS